MKHQLVFHHPVPGTTRVKSGYALSWSGTQLMGILNVTPDSFSDGGQFTQVEQAIKQAYHLLENGAQVLDIGGESSRPGAEPVSARDELDRVLPVIRLLAESSHAIISIDTFKPEVAFEALKAGAHIVNDISGLRNPEMMDVCVKQGAPAIIMHMQGTPQTMQQLPTYTHVSAEVFTFLTQQAQTALNAGVPSVMLDPGFGFGKTLEHNLTLLRELPKLTQSAHPVLVGASRKRSIHEIANVPEAKNRDPGSVALHLYAAQQGAAMIRVHNVAAHQQALSVWDALHG